VLDSPPPSADGSVSKKLPKARFESMIKHGVCLLKIN
jgi:hypothetical protein